MKGSVKQITTNYGEYTPFFVLCISVKLKNLKANHNIYFRSPYSRWLCISVKLKNLKANHNVVGNQVSAIELCISVKLKNLKANHNF